MPPGAVAVSTSDRFGEDVKRKTATKRKRRGQSSVIIQSQDDGGDEIVWKVSPTAERLLVAPQSRANGEGRSVLQPCQASNNKCEPVLEILSKTSTSSDSNSSKKKKSPGMAGRLEMWLSSSQQIQNAKPSADLQYADKENQVEGRSKKGITPSNAKPAASSTKRPPTSSQRRSTSAKKKAVTTEPGQRRKALLDLLDKVDDAVKGSPLIQTKLNFTRKSASAAVSSSGCLPEPAATGKEEKVFCETALAQSSELVPAPAINKNNFVPSADDEVQQENRSSLKVQKEHKELGDDSTDALQLENRSTVSVQKEHQEFGDSRTVLQQDNRSSTKVQKENQEFGNYRTEVLQQENRSSAKVQKENQEFGNFRTEVLQQENGSSAKVQKESREFGDYSAEVISKVKVLDIRTEANDEVANNEVQLLPSVREMMYPEDADNCTANPRPMSCDPGLEVARNLASIQFTVLQVADGEHNVSPSVLYPQKTLTLLDEHNGIQRVAQLRDSWVHAVIQPGDTVNVIGDFDKDGICVIDREQNLLVINPDLLVSGSKVGSSFSCSRRAIFDERIKSNDVIYPALMGTMLHQLFQVALRSECPTSKILNQEVKLIVQHHIDGLYATGVSDKEAREKLVAAIPSILSWWQQFVGGKGSSGQEIEFGRIHGRQPVAVQEVVDIEEMVWSPKYGLKGMIDASISVKMGNMNLGEENQIMPFELKTGKATTGQAGMEHRAQVILYTLLMSDRYMRPIKGGLLYYLHTNETQGVEAQHPELVGLVMRRNEHANNLLKASFDQSLPPMLRNYHMCGNCQHLDTCTMYHKAQDKGTGETSGLNELFDRSTNHLIKTHLQFFQQWDRLIDLEARNVSASHSEIWRMPSGKREEQGRCLSSLVLDTLTENDSEQKKSPNAFFYRFRRATSYGDSSSHATQSSQASFQDRSFSSGDYVILSTENGHPAVAGGTVLYVTKDSIMLRLAHRLRIPGNQDTVRNGTPSQELWRIDKDETASHLAIMRFNLLQLFVRTNGDEQRRSLVVDLKAPKFEGTLPDSDPAAVYLKSVNGLNYDQVRAIQKIIVARDYALILGMPGTGKTSTIVHAVLALLARKSTVLLTSYTNSAVDNILLRLKKLGVDFIRVGRPDAIHPELRHKALGCMELTSVKEFQSVVEKAQVVGVTCLGINHPLFTKLKFDVCIVDEAGQITLPVCLGPLRYARSFVLVGDHYQLPPLVRSVEARDEGMAVSLFRRLSEAHPHSVTVLQSQYRMCAAIMALSNILIYNNRLLCGSPLIAKACLQVHPSSKTLPPWLSQVVNPMQPLLFLDTDNSSAEESRKRNSITNPTEAVILLRIIQALFDGGVDMEKIGVISPYNAQVDLIRRKATKEGFSNLEVHTVDKYQGREKDCVLISFVRSNNQQHISGSLLGDWHRINVAITRAKTKLVMVGSRKTLSSIPILRLLMEKFNETGSLLQLPSNCVLSPAW